MKKLIAILALVFAATACQPPGPTVPARFGLDACNHVLPGSPQLRDIDASGIPIVCEARPANTPGDAEGWWDGTTIHVWPAVLGEPETYAAKTAGHEYGHAMNARHPEWTAAWQQIKGTAPGHDTSEDLADSFAYCIYPHYVGVGYRFYVSATTPAQCDTLRSWYAAR